MELLDELSPAARLIGAVNTVVNDNGRLTGYNTDGVGYMQAVRDAGYDVISVGKIFDIFDGEGLTESNKSKSSVHGMEQTIEISKRDYEGLDWREAAKKTDELMKSRSFVIFKTNIDVDTLIK